MLNAFIKNNSSSNWKDCVDVPFRFFMREKVLENLLCKIQEHDMNVAIDEKFYRKVGYMEDIMFHTSKSHEEYYDCGDLESRINEVLTFTKLLKTREKVEDKNWRNNVNLQFRHAVCEKIKGLLIHKMKHQLLLDPKVIDATSTFQRRVEYLEEIILREICQSSIEYYDYRCLYERVNLALKIANEKILM